MKNKVQVLRPNTMTLDEHIQKIEVARDKIRSGVFEFASAIADAVEQLDKSVTQTMLAPRLGMSQSNLSKWIDIGTHPIIMGMQNNLPPTFGTLYDLTRLEKKYVSHYGETKGNARFSEVFSKNKIVKNSERMEVGILLDEIEQRIKTKKTRQNQNAATRYVGWRRGTTLNDGCVSLGSPSAVASSARRPTVSGCVRAGRLLSSIPRGSGIERVTHRSSNRLFKSISSAGRSSKALESSPSH